jgi:hypothetical protein
MSSSRLNSQIAEAPVVYFLGAGASVPFGLPAMEGLTESFWESLNSGELSESPSFESLLDELNFRGFRSGESDWNLESILEQLSLLERLRGVQEEKRDTITRLRNEIVAHIRNQLSPSHPNIKDNHYYYDLLFRSSGQRTVPVFTTNYDLIVEKSAAYYEESWTLLSGFRDTPDRRSLWSASTVHSYAPSTRELDIVLFKLHGSLDWFREKETKEVVSLSHEPKKLLDRVALWPAETKFIFQEPYFTAYVYLGECLRNARLLVVVGYSFSDEPIVERIAGSTAENPKGLKILWFDPSGKTEPRLGIHSTPCKFGEDTESIVSDINDSLQEFDRAEGYIAAGSRVRSPLVQEVSLSRPRVPFANRQFADFYHFSIAGSSGFKLRVSIPRELPYWRAGLILAPEDYIHENDSSRSIIEYFLFHIGRGAQKNPKEFFEALQYVGYLKGKQVVAHSSQPEFSDATFEVRADLVRSEDTLSLHFLDQVRQIMVPSDYLTHLYLVAWADRLATFEIDLVVEIYSSY